MLSHGPQHPIVNNSHAHRPRADEAGSSVPFHAYRAGGDVIEVQVVEGKH